MDNNNSNTKRSDKTQDTEEEDSKIDERMLYTIILLVSMDEDMKSQETTRAQNNITGGSESYDEQTHGDDVEGMESISILPEDFFGDNIDENDTSDNDDEVEAYLNSMPDELELYEMKGCSFMRKHIKDEEE